MKTNAHNQHERDDCQFCQDHLIDAAMGTLEPDDERRMQKHLVRCVLCRAELAEIEEKLLLVAASVDQIDPPENAKAHFMDRFETEKTQPSESSTPVKTLTTKARPSSRKDSASPQTGRARALPWSYGGVLAGLCVALLIIGAWSFLPLEDSGSDLPSGQIEVMAMDKTCEDCDTGTGGHIGADPNEKDGLMVAWNLDPQRKHEIWCVNRDGKHTKVDDLIVTDGGTVMQKFILDEHVGGYQQIYVLRDDGAEELTVVPATKDDVDPDSSANPTPPAE